MRYIGNKNLGLDRENLLYVPVDMDLYTHSRAFADELRRQASIRYVTATNSDFTDYSSGSTSDLQWPGKPADGNIWLSPLIVDFDFVEAFNVQMKEGRAFSREFATDSTAFILNEDAVRVMGLKNPIGEELSLWGRKGKVIGVARNFHFVSLRSPIGPLVIHCNPGNTYLYYVKARAGQTLSVIETLQRIHKKYSSYPFEVHFLDQTLERQYRSEMIMQQLSSVFAGLAIFIACLGLFGLATFTTEQRTKEIGIRKVLGASVSNIVNLLSKDFIKLVLIANVIAWPLAWYAMHRWLQDFAYRISIPWWVFGAAGVAALLIALLTVSFQAIKAAVANPVKSLRTE